MLSPFLLVGVGGSGGKTLRAVRQKLEMRLRLAGWTEGIPAAWQFLHFDTPIIQDGNEFPAPFLPAESYVGLAAAHGNYQNIVTSIEAPMNKDLLDEALRQIPNPKQVSVPVAKGAGQFRAVGRAVALSRLKQIGEAARLAMAKAKSPDSLAKLKQLSERLGADPKQGISDNVILLVVSSVAGGSGAGQYIDVVDAVKAQFANETSQWAQDSYGILYAPDVFDGISGAAGIPSNALATISETLNGNWNHNVNDSVQALFAAQGVKLSTGEANDRVGVHFPMIVGRQGATTSFKGQRDVYLSIASTISAWMSQESFQDSIEAYFKTNWPANAAPDNTLFRSNPILNMPPMGAIGFGRVTLAREEFLEYSKERFAKGALDRLLRAHVLDSRDPLFKVKSNEAYVKQSIEENYVKFFDASGFNEESEQKNQVLDALRSDSDLQSRKANFMLLVQDSVNAQIDVRKGGLESSQWVDRFETERYRLIENAMAEEKRIRGEKYLEWIKTAPNKLFETVSRYAIDVGLPVTAGLLHQLADSLSKAAEELASESSQRIDAVARLRPYLSSDLGTGGQGGIIRPDSDPYRAALARVGDSFTWEAESQLRQETATLLLEARKDFVEPLSQFINDIVSALNSATTADRNTDGRENDFSKWPGAESVEVPIKYFPSSNEKMLVEPKEFPSEFDRLVKASDRGEGVDSFLEALKSLLTKRFVGDSEVTQPLIGYSVNSGWAPSAIVGESARVTGAKKPRFTMPQEIADYIQMAEGWIQRTGTPFGGYLTETIAQHLDPSNSSPAEFSRRKDRFLSHTKAAFSASSPLVKLNGTLLNQIHDRAVGQMDTVIITPIPLTRSAALYEATKDVIMEGLSHFADAETKAENYFSDKDAGSIEFMQAMGHGVIPMVMSSIMEPIASNWSQVSNNEAGRSAFWQWKRARLLSESVPLDRDALTGLIEGWYLSRAFHLLARENNDTLGPKIAVKAKDGLKLDFPHPLLYAGQLQEIDYLAAVVESTIIVQAAVNSSSSLDPLKAYNRLIELGGTPKALSPEVVEWLANGVGFATAEGSQSVVNMVPTGGDAEARKYALKQYLGSELDKLEQNLSRHRESSTVYEMPVIWELIPQIRFAITQTMTKVGTFVAPEKDWD
jgi:hypothetical protein